MPKQTRSSNKKVVASKSGRKISTPVGVLFALSIGLVLAIAGTYGFTKYKERDLQAKAARWKEVKPWKIVKGQDDGVKFVACREYLASGPDSQQNKPVRISAMASKPQSLQPEKMYAATQPTQPRFTIGVYRKIKHESTDPLLDGVDVWRGVYEYDTRAWWGNELASLTNVKSPHNLRTSDKLLPSVISKIGTRDSVESETIFKNGVSVKYVTPPNPETYRGNSSKKADVKAYMTALEIWQKKSTSVAQLPNCN